MRGILEHLTKQFISWRFRKRSPFVNAFSVSGAILIAVFGLGNLTGALSYRDFTFELTQSDSIESTILTGAVVVCLIVFLLSFIAFFVQVLRDCLSGKKERIIVIEGRGLRDDDGVSLADSLNDEFPKIRLPYILDLRQRLDGKLLQPEDLIPKISAVKVNINQMRSGDARSNTLIAYGGLTAVPLTFLTGVELDDEGAITIFDWDRAAEKWRPLDDLDDGRRLSEPNLEDFPASDNAILAVSVSYPIDTADLETSFDLPIVRMDLDGRSSSSHWSVEKQSAIASQFFEVSKQLSARGVKHIHLILAAPNSVVFNFGRRYDKRNLPELTVYQYERSDDLKYPWGIRMPVCSTLAAQVEKTIPPKFE